VAPIEGDAAELREGLLNIIFNAMDAMPGGGKITVETKHDKKWVTISISDTGAGMPEEVKSKLFEPFFTTKKHKGTGLGLSVTYGIVKRHRGEISFKSKVGAGTTFYIKLPAGSGEVKKSVVEGVGGEIKNASILIVDDNPEVAGVLCLTLRRMGHKVTETSSGEAAINTFEIGKFDMVITDLGMPDMSGHEVAKIVKEIRPGTPVLVISGWGGQLNLADMPEVDGVIAKPFSKDVLSKKIADLLSKKVPEAKAVAPDAAGDEKGEGEIPVADDDKHVGKQDSKVWKAGKRGEKAKKDSKKKGGKKGK
jgi:CheY-like chemotaxis protein